LDLAGWPALMAVGGCVPLAAPPKNRPRLRARGRKSKAQVPIPMCMVYQASSLFSANPPTPSRPEFLPMMRPVRAPGRDQGPQSRIAKLHFLRACCSIAASYHLPLHLSPSDGLHIEAALASATRKLLHTVDMLCIDYYEACQREKVVRIVGTTATRG
jgi:hypothetical protein